MNFWNENQFNRSKDGRDEKARTSVVDEKSAFCFRKNISSKSNYRVTKNTFGDRIPYFWTLSIFLFPFSLFLFFPRESSRSHLEDIPILHPFNPPIWYAIQPGQATSQHPLFPPTSRETSGGKCEVKISLSFYRFSLFVFRFLKRV